MRNAPKGSKSTARSEKTNLQNRVSKRRTHQIRKKGIEVPPDLKAAVKSKTKMVDGMPTISGGQRARIMQDKFLEYYFAGFNQTQAARLAGYSDPQQSSYILVTSNNYVRDKIAEYQAKLQQKYEISREDALKGFVEAIDMARSLSEPDAMIRGWDKICQVMGHYAPKKSSLQVTDTKTRVLHLITSKSDEELLTLVGGTEGLTLENQREEEAKGQ